MTAKGGAALAARPWRRGLGDAALVPRPWRRALAEASRSGWRGNRAGGGRRSGGLGGGPGGGMVRSAKLQRAQAADWAVARRWHGPEREASASACGGMGTVARRWHGPEREASASACGGMATRPWRRGLGDVRSLKLRGPGGAGIVQAAGGVAVEWGRWHGGGMVRSAKLQRAHAAEWAAVWRRGLGAARSLKLRGPGGAGIGQAAGGVAVEWGRWHGGGMVRSAKLQRAHAADWAAVARAVAWSGARSFSERMRRYGDAALATRPWRRALAEASRSGWRGNRAGGGRRWNGRWHGGGMVRSAKLQRAHAAEWGRWPGGGMVRSAKLQRAHAAVWRRGLGDAALATCAR
jgi:hypothetical protein